MTETANTGAHGARRAPSFADGRSVGIGSLPHRDACAAADFAISEFDVPTVPSLPKRSRAESMIGQALVGLPGVSLGRDGNVTLDPAHLGDDTCVITDLHDDAFGGLRAFLHAATTDLRPGHPVKWQFVGPITLGVALQRAGLAPAVAFPLAGRAVRAHLETLSAAIRRTLPDSSQMVMLDEPAFADLMSADFAIPPDEAVDLMSTAMAALPGDVVAGIHCCAPCDVATMLATGPQVISLPVSPGLAEWAGYVTRFLDDGGIVTWGVVASGGPVASTAARNWRALSDVWCSLVQRGCDPVALRRQSLVSTTCGLAGHSESVARRLVRLTSDVGARVQDQANAARFSLGA